MATLVDEGRHEDADEVISEDSQPTLEDAVSPVKETTTAPVEEAIEVPDKYQGKSISEVVKMHQEAEQLLGRQSSEVGELRKVVDEFVMSQSKREDTVDEEEIDYFSDPEKAIQKAIEKHPAVVEAQKASVTMKQSAAQNILTQKHPDMKEILQDEAFMNWVKESSFRTKLLSEADRNYDYEAADEIFSLWKDRKALVTQTASVEKQSRANTVKNGKKIFRRADIIKLMRNDPNRYEALQGEIMKAYAEGRVK
jgi:hypothetical protein